MNNKYLMLVVGVLAVLLTSCASAVKESALEDYKRIGILNLFPEKPTYSKFTLTGDDIGKAELPGAKAYLTQKVTDYLKEGGFEVTEVTDHSALKRDEVDMILELQPMQRDPREPGSIYRYQESDEELDDGTNGYGFFYKSLLLIKQGPMAYVSIRVVPVIMDDGEVESLSAYTSTDGYDLNIKELPNAWRRMNAREKQEAETSLQRNIDETVESILSDMNF